VLKKGSPSAIPEVAQARQEVQVDDRSGADLSWDVGMCHYWSF
jgi:hypothetical protein